MVFFRQVFALVEKTLLIVAVKHWFFTSILYLIAPVIFFFFISYSKNLFVPPSYYGIGQPAPLRTFGDSLSQSYGVRNKVALVNNGYTGGNISRVIDILTAQITPHGLTVSVLSNENDLLTTCRSTIRGVTPCYGAASFLSSPDEGSSAGEWNYTIYADGALGSSVNVNSDSNDQAVYILPFQYAIDSAIASLSNQQLPTQINQYPYTSETDQEYRATLTQYFMQVLINILAVAFFIGMCGVCYELPGFLARERELGIAQLIEAMMPNRQRWQPQLARLLSTVIAFDVLYLPGWIIGGAVVSIITFPNSNPGISIGFFIVAGLSLTSWALAAGTLFKKAQLSGITIVIASIVLAIIIQVVPPGSTTAAAILCILFPPMNYTLFIIYAAYFQQQSRPMQLSQSPSNASWQMPGYAFFLIAAAQTVIYPLLGIIIERLLHGAGGRSRTLRHDGIDSKSAIKVTALTKHFSGASVPFLKKAALVRAVEEVSLEVLEGQIMVLLGANGSGKSTTLDMLAGLSRPTAGDIEINARGGIGYCPQKNVLWDELSVLEHVHIFNKLKATTVDNTAVLKALIAKCDLHGKINARASSLSGGQKRKCQLAIMLTGDSQVCLLDEVSSGLDPVSRRKIWDILLAEKGRRSLLLTTHFLDEADLLSDEIVVLSKGQIAASGTSVALKHQLGDGYKVRVYDESNKHIPAELLLLSQSPTVLRGQTVYQFNNAQEVSTFINGLEGSGIRNYQVNGPTIEDVFLKIAQEVREEQVGHSLDVEKATVLDAGDKPSVSDGRQSGPTKISKRVGFWRQTWVLLCKRATITRHNPFPILAALIVPIIGAGLISIFLQNFTQLSCDPTVDAGPSFVVGLDTILALNVTIPTGPQDTALDSRLTSLYPLLTTSDFPAIASLADLQSYVSANFSSVQPGGFFLGDTPTYAWEADAGVYASVAIQNLVSNALLPDIPIVTNYNAFTFPFGSSAGKSIQFVLYLGLILSAAPGFFALYPTLERLRQVRTLHYSNGVRAGPLWLAYTLFDLSIVVLSSAIITIILVVTFHGWYGPGYLFLILVLFGLSAILMSYVVSLFAGSQLAAFAIAAGGQCVFFLLYLIALLCILTFANPTAVDADILRAHYSIALFFPAGNLLRALLLSLNDFSLICKDSAPAPYLGAFDIYGSCIFYLILQSIVFFGILLWVDSGSSLGILTRRNRTKQGIEEEEKQYSTDQVQTEAQRVDSCTDSLRVQHVSKAFGSFTAVDDVSFGVPNGQAFALLGPNGAGKSTLISLIRGDLQPESRSQIWIEDESIVTNRASARLRLGVCPQFDSIDLMSTTEHLRFYARARGIENIEHHVHELIRAVGLTGFGDRMANKFSGGNKRKLSLAIALIGDPSVLLLDEPSSGMDAASKRVMWKTLRTIAADRALVLTTHSMEEADAIADRAGIMAGRMLAIGTGDELRKAHSDYWYIHLVHKSGSSASPVELINIQQFVVDIFPGAILEQRPFSGQLRFSVPSGHALQGPIARDVKTETSQRTSKSENGTGIAAVSSKLNSHKSQLGLEYYSVSQATLDQVFLSIIGKHDVQEEDSTPPARNSRRRLFTGRNQCI